MGAAFHHNYDVDVMLGGLVVESAEGQWQNSSIFILLVLATHAGLATIIIITIIICLPYIYIIICIPYIPYVYHIYHMYTIYHYMYSTLSFGKPGEDEASSIYVQLFLEFLWTVFSSFLQLVVFLNFFQFSWRPLPFSFNSTPFVSLNQFVKQWNRGNLTFPRN